MMRTLVFRLRQLTIAALLVALMVPVAAATARADGGGCATPLQSFTFIAVLPVPGVPAGQLGTITTSECLSPTPTGAVIATGTFKVTVSGQVIGAGTLYAVHQGFAVAAVFEGEILSIDKDFSGSLTFNGSTGQTIVHFEDVGTVTVTFHCTPTDLFSYSCSVP